MKNRFFIALGVGLVLSGCSTIAERTNFMSDDDVSKHSARALGYETEQVTLVSRSTEGTNTYAVVKVPDGTTYTCILNGGNLLSAGMVNPPTCNRR